MRNLGVTVTEPESDDHRARDVLVSLADLWTLPSGHRSAAAMRVTDVLRG